jgi:hypothetical protein
MSHEDQLEALEAAESRQRQRAKFSERERDMWKAATRRAESERDEALAVLREMIDRWAPHCGSCCVAVNGKVTVTEASCVCDDLHKRARKLTKMPPYDAPTPFAPRIGDLCRTGSGTPSRYVGGGKALGVSAQDSDLILRDATPPKGGEDKLPLPTMREVFQHALKHATDEELEVLFDGK